MTTIGQTESRTTSTFETTGDAQMEIRILLARFETKLDLVLGQHEATLKDHESRLRTVEDRKTVTPMALLASSATVVALLGGVFTILDRLYA
jgi:hypothetical protein